MTPTTSTPHRTKPLTASSAAADTIPSSDMVTAAAPESDAIAERDRRFAAGVRALRMGGGAINLDERILMVLGGVLVPLGIIVVLLGWWGASHSPYVFDQIPYMISGGLLGIGLIFLGAFLYFAHWMTELLKENRQQSTALLAALEQLQDRLAGESDVVPAQARGTANGSSIDHEAVSLVATQRGTMAHVPDCVVVAGKPGLRRVTEADGLTPCKLCAPF